MRFLHFPHIISTVVILSFTGSVISAQNDTDGYPLYKRKIKEAIHNNSDSAFSLIQEELDRANQRGDQYAIAFLYIHKGILYFHTNQNLTLEYFYKAKEILEELQDTSSLAGVYRAMGSLDLLSLKQKTALLNRAMYLSKSAKDTFNIISSYNNLGNAYTWAGIHDSGIFHYNQALYYLQLYTDSVQEAAIYSNIGMIESTKGNYSRALEYYKTGLQKLPSAPHFDGNNHRVTIYQNIMLAHILLKQYPDSIFHYLELVKEFHDDRPDTRMKTYLLLSAFFEEKDPEKALQYHLKADSIKEVLNEKNSGNALSLLELEYDSRLKAQEMSKLRSDIQKANYIRAFLLITLTLLIISLYQMYKKKQAQRKMMNMSLKNSELRQKYLNEELNYANKELMSFATTIVENQNILDELKGKISETSKKKGVKEMREQLKDIQIMLHQVFQSDNYRQEFLKRSKELNHSLIFYLKNNYKQLSDSDINILILLFLKFKSKEISVLYNVEPKSIDQRRRRLRQKLNMEKAESFDKLFDKALAGIRTFET